MTNSTENAFKVSETVVHRVVGNETIVIDTKTGLFFHFNLATEPFLRFFKVGATLNEFLTISGLEEMPESERSHLVGFSDFLLTQGVFEKTVSENTDRTSLEYQRPEFLRHGTRRLEEYTSEIAVLTQGYNYYQT